MRSSPESGTRELEELRTGEAFGGYPDGFLNPLPSYSNAKSDAPPNSLTNPARGMQSMDGPPSESTVSDFYVIAGVGNGVPLAAENELHITGNFDRPPAMVGPPNPPPVGRYLRPSDFPHPSTRRTRRVIHFSPSCRYFTEIYSRIHGCPFCLMGWGIGAVFLSDMSVNWNIDTCQMFAVILVNWRSFLASMLFQLGFA